ncbi:hypothetical protein ABZ865_21155 [Streptomyces sp. NPDC047085]|uniref:hypothetical protein n=1 Tax=Streptomyces sp. NPDC047085 TaxID=3155140 RepID=UPI0033D742FC
MMFDPSDSSLVVSTPGRYLLKSRLLWQFTPNVEGERELAIEVNGGPVADDVQDTNGVSGFAGAVSQEVSTILPLKAGDRITLHAFQTTGLNASSLQFNGAQRLAPQLQAEWQAP